MITTEKKFGHYVLTPASEIFQNEQRDSREEYSAYLEEVADYKRKLQVGNSSVPLSTNLADGRPPCAIPPCWTALKLLAVRKYNHNTSIFTFALPPRRKLSLPPGAFLFVRAPNREHGGGDAIRPYTSVSDPAIRGSFDILVKRYDAWGTPPSCSSSSSSSMQQQPGNAPAFSMTSLGLTGAKGAAISNGVGVMGHSVNPYRPPGAVSTYIHELKVGDTLDFKHSAACRSKLSMNLLLGSRKVVHDGASSDSRSKLADKAEGKCVAGSDSGGGGGSCMYIDQDSEQKQQDDKKLFRLDMSKERDREVEHKISYFTGTGTETGTDGMASDMLRSQLRSQSSTFTSSEAKHFSSLPPVQHTPPQMQMEDTGTCTVTCSFSPSPPAKSQHSTQSPRFKRSGGTSASTTRSTSTSTTHTTVVSTHSFLKDGNASSSTTTTGTSTVSPRSMGTGKRFVRTHTDSEMKVEWTEQEREYYNQEQEQEQEQEEEEEKEEEGESAFCAKLLLSERNSAISDDSFLSESAATAALLEYDSLTSASASYRDPDLAVSSMTIIAVGVGVAPMIQILRTALYGLSDGDVDGEMDIQGWDTDNHTHTGSTDGEEEEDMSIKAPAPASVSAAAVLSEDFTYSTTVGGPSITFKIKDKIKDKTKDKVSNKDKDKDKDKSPNFNIISDPLATAVTAEHWNASKVSHWTIAIPGERERERESKEIRTASSSTTTSASSTSTEDSAAVITSSRSSSASASTSASTAVEHIPDSRTLTPPGIRSRSGSLSRFATNIRTSALMNGTSNKLEKIVFLYGVRTVEDILCKGTLMEFERDFPERFKVVFCIGSRYENVHIGAKLKDKPDYKAQTPASAPVVPDSVFDTLFSSAGAAGRKDTRGGGTHNQYLPPSLPMGYDHLDARNREVGWVNYDIILKHQAQSPLSLALRSVTGGGESTRVVVCGLPSVYDKLCGSRFVNDVPADSVLGRLGYDKETVIKL